MRASFRWLKDYVDITLTAKELADRLTMAGLEVKSIQTPGGSWDKVVVGEVVGVAPHPNADRLRLATINVGTGRITVICGAPNIVIGQKIAFAQLGTHLIDGHTGQPTVVKPARIRGVVSEGMVCSEKELGISDEHEGILVLPPDAPIGCALATYLGDAVIDLDVTPNRPDCLSVIGIAREISALTGTPLRLPEVHYEETEGPIDSFASVNIVDPDLCPRYCASLVTGIRVGPSPSWMQQRLNSYGMRPINNVVDVTNYVMLEYGQPLHAFDYLRLEGRKIIVRRTKRGETITTLDGSKRTLAPDMLVIADKEKAVAVAGIMGGLDSEVTDKTDTILLESANFNQAVIRRGCGNLQFRSEASMRFDKGLNSELPLVPLRRATQLLLELAGGSAARGLIDIYPGKPELKSVLLSVQEVKRTAGLEVTKEEMIKVLRALGFECEERVSDSEISARVPCWRSDIRCSADLVEEIVRIIGYEKVPMTRLASPLPQPQSRLSPAARQRDLRDKFRSILTGFGFQEVLTYSLVSLERLRKLSPWLELTVAPLKVANPMTREQEYLRTSLRAGVLASLAHNQKFEQAGLRLFEIGKVFLPRGDDLPEEREMLCAVLSGSKAELSWQGDNEPLDFFDAKGAVESFLSHLALKPSFDIGDDEILLARRGANIMVDDDKMGVVGELHPKVAEAFELSDGACLIEIDLEKLLNKLAPLKQYQPIPRFPGMTRDIALVVDEQVSYQRVEEIVRGFPLVTKVTLFDLYRGEQVAKGKKSFAIRIVYQSPKQTLTDDEVARIQEKMLDGLSHELGAALRS